MESEPLQDVQDGPFDASAENESDYALLVPEQFSVRDDASANWVIRKLVERRAYAERVKDWDERERSRAAREEESLLLRFGEQLMDYARRKIAEQGGRRKSVCLPAGTVGFRKEGVKLVVDDEQAVLVCRVRPSASRPST